VVKVLAIDELAWPFKGGHEVMTHQLLTALVERGHSVRMVCGSPGPGEIDGIEYQRLERPDPRTFWNMDYDKRSGLTPKSEEIRRWIAEYRPDAIFTGGVWTREAVIAAKTAKVLSATLTHLAYQPPAAADLVICDSEFVRGSVEIRGKSAVVHPPAQWKPTAPRSEGRGCYTMLNLYASKGVHVFHKIAGELPDRKFLGIEGGWGKQERYPKPNIRYAKSGQFPMEKILSEWTRVLLMPSKYESFGLVALEAQGFGVPVIASDILGLREALGDGAIYCDPFTVPEWVAAIRRLDDPEEYRRLSEAAIENARAKEAENPRGRFVEVMERFVAEGPAAPTPFAPALNRLDRSFDDALRTLDREIGASLADREILVARWREAAEATGGPGDGMPVDHDAAAFLLARVAALKSPTIVEMGCGTGYSSSVMAAAASVRGGKVYSFDDHDGFFQIAERNHAKLPWAKGVSKITLTDLSKPDAYKIAGHADILFDDCQEGVRAAALLAAFKAGILSPATEIYIHDAHEPNEQAYLNGWVAALGGRWEMVLNEGRGIARYYLPGPRVPLVEGLLGERAVTQGIEKSLPGQVSMGGP